MIGLFPSGSLLLHVVCEIVLGLSVSVCPFWGRGKSRGLKIYTRIHAHVLLCVAGSLTDDALERGSGSITQGREIKPTPL